MTTTMTEKVFPPSPEFSEGAWISSREQYQEMYDRSVNDPAGFWAEAAEDFHWFQKWDKVFDYNYDRGAGKIQHQWYINGKTNIAYNCLDRHLEKRGDQTAILWVGNNPGEDKRFTYNELHAEVCKFSNVLKAQGIQKGDRVSLYMQMIPELAIAMLACARIGAIHSIVFGAFSPDALADRCNDSDVRLVVTQDTGLRGAKDNVPMKTNADLACEKAATVEKVIVVQRTGHDVPMTDGRDFWWHEEMSKVDAVCEAEQMDAEDPLFLLYTSGSTGKPKGVQHHVGGYMVYAAMTHKYVFDYHEGDTYWCTADIGWVTGHSYIVYGPLCNGATTMMFEGVPTWPNPDRFWEICAEYKVNQFYTAPTAIRAIAAKGDEWVKKHDLSSLRLLGSVGEPINPEAWMWYHEKVGGGNCPIVDTWWQTETGGIMITPLPGAWATKPGSATLPFFGVQPVILDPESGAELTDIESSGVLAIKHPWPGQMRTLWGDQNRFEETYFDMYKGYYFAGDGCRRDSDGFYWITGRVDDVINVSGHRMGTAEVESALVSHPNVAEAAVVGFPHEIKGQGIYAYVTLNDGVDYSDELKKELIVHVRKEIGPIAAPDVIHWAPGLPKTRSGKIMRRILRKIAEGAPDEVGDVSTLADPSVVEGLIKSF
jgi:acetyl-CoA synthetase